MRHNAFMDTIAICIDMIDTCTQHSVKYSPQYTQTKERGLCVHFEDEAHPLVRFQDDRCYGDLNSPILDPEGRRFAPQKNLPLHDENALRCFLLLHLCPSLALMDALKHLCGAKTSLACELDERTGAYVFTNTLSKQSVPIYAEKHTRIRIGPHHHHRRASTRTAFGFGDNYSPYPFGRMVEHAGLLAQPAAYTTTTTTTTEAPNPEELMQSERTTKLLSTLLEALGFGPS